MAVIQVKKENAVKGGRGRGPKNQNKLLIQTKTGSSQMADDKQLVVRGNTVKHECKKRKLSKVNESDGNSFLVLQRAREVQANIAPEYPSLIKCMLPSHVTGGFWLGLPKKFCDLHLPKHDAQIILEDESGNEHETKYLCEKVGLSAGWRGFSIRQKLVTGDVLVFQLVNPSKFKVYILRSNGSDEVNGALGLLKLDGCTSVWCWVNENKDADKDAMAFKEEGDNYWEPLTKNIKQENFENSNQGFHNTGIVPVQDLLENDTDKFYSEILGGLRFSDAKVEFNQVKSIEDFNVVVNGLIINSKLPGDVLEKYFALCCSQKSFLHNHVLDDLNCGLVAGIIAETVNIADAIKVSKLSTPQKCLQIWDKTLESFEGLGMNVGFLRARLNQLMNRSFKSERYNEAVLERARAEEEIRNLEANLLQVREKIKRLDAEIETLKADMDDHELLFREVAQESW